MNDIITIGDAMITFDPSSTGPLRFSDCFKRKAGGAEFNVAVGCSRLGLKSGWIGRLGKDEFGRYIYNFARGEGIDVSEVKLEEGYPTSLNFKEIQADGSGKTFYYRHKSPTETLLPETLNEAYFQYAKLLHITGVFPAISKQNIRVIDQAVTLAHKHGVKISMDPNIRLKLWSKEEARETLLKWMPYVDYLLTGLDEAELLFGTSDVSELIEKAKQYNITHMFVKLGEDGSLHWTEDEIIEAPATKVDKVADTVGAGDGFDAGVICGLLKGWEPKRILEFANTIGAMVVGVYGDNEGLPYLEEVLERLGEKDSVVR
ncbi:2-dehydro-3-deoxygluconokinase [Thalassobacillus devorans]|uniref:2-dehydro-3-deoxygluconokinase n=1 Tax=Thalassobacillus devorans TaxID=279813 RepID=A0ABQ1NSW9_9BACI|nr:sugar kinase [Thalassobacillus devorans]NIK28649.1 2-dehydro-3-deoxygluconokinase [Thalassobacillus devorans]GGC84590.1 2-dehydro-3-deoxygluconokinase [Thalassobacillus devorans]